MRWKVLPRAHPEICAKCPDFLIAEYLMRRKNPWERRPRRDWDNRGGDAAATSFRHVVCTGVVFAMQNFSKTSKQSNAIPPPDLRFNAD
jgi:hypothetical protein